MAIPVKQQSHKTRLRVAKHQEGDPFELPLSPSDQTWIPLSVNGYSDFGAEYIKVRRNTLDGDRQSDKGSRTDKNVSASIELDFIPEMIQPLFESFMFSSEEFLQGSSRASANRTRLDYPGWAGSSIAGAEVRSAEPQFAGLGDAGVLGGGSSDGDVGLLYRVPLTPGGVFTKTPLPGELVFHEDFSDDTYNGLFRIHESDADGYTLDTTISPPTTTIGGTLTTGMIDGVSRIVGYEFHTGQVRVVMDGDIATIQNQDYADRMTSSDNDDNIPDGDFDFTTLGLRPGDWFFLGSDDADKRFVNNRGFCCVKEVTSDKITLLKTQHAFETEENVSSTSEAGKAIQIFYPRTIRNAVDFDDGKQYWQLERTLGKADTTYSHLQSEYVIGAVLNEFKINIPQADKMTCSLGFVGLDHELRDGSTLAVAPKSAGAGTNSPALGRQRLVNTSTDISRARLAPVDLTTSFSTNYFTHITSMEFMVNNGISADKAVGVDGGFDTTEGRFTPSGTVDIYFANVNSTRAIRDNDTVSFDIHIVRGRRNAISIDLPAVEVEDGSVTVESEASIMQKLAYNGNRALEIGDDFNYCLAWMTWNYLPELADDLFNVR